MRRRAAIALYMVMAIGFLGLIYAPWLVPAARWIVAFLQR